MGLQKQAVLIGWKDIADYLGYSVSTARRRAAEGLPVFRVGGTVRANPAEIDRWLRAQPRVEPAGAGETEESGAIILEGKDLPIVVSGFHGPQLASRYAVIPLGIDAKELARVEGRLRSAEKYYRWLLETVPAWIWETDADGEYTYSNVATIEILGYRPEELYGFRPDEFLVSPEDVGKYKRALERLRIDKEVIRDLRCRFVHRDNSERWLEIDAEPQFDAAGKFAGVRAVSRDITDRRRIEEALREAHERLSATLDALPDLLFEVDVRGRIFDLRAPQRELFSISPEELLGRTFNEIFPEKAARTIADALAKAAATGSHTGATYSSDTPAGLRWFELSIAAKGDPKTSEGRLIVMARDVTERRRAEVALRASEKKYRSLADNIPLGVFRISGDANGEILSANAAFASMFGFEKPEDMLHHRVADLYADPTARFQFIGALAKLGTVTNYEVRGQRKDGREFWASISARAVYTDDGKIEYFDGVVENVNGRRSGKRGHRPPERVGTPGAEPLPGMNEPERRANDE